VHEQDNIYLPIMIMENLSILEIIEKLKFYMIILFLACLNSCENYTNSSVILKANKGKVVCL
jgi:hypothetical protein